MHIVCPNCSTSYAIEPASLGAAGRTVRCARCKTTWFANGPQAVPEMATADTAGEAQEAFKGVIRPDQPLGTAGEAGAPPPEETDHAAETTGHGESVPVADIPVAMDAPSLVPSIESPATPDAASDQDEIESFPPAARGFKSDASRRDAHRAGRRSSWCCSRSTLRWSELAARSCDFSRRRLRSLLLSVCRSICVT